jgi:hypothetical protein
MSAVLWTDIDNYLLTNILADMGSAGSYVTLIVNEVLLSDSFKPETYDPPTVVIISNNVRPIEQGPHGDGTVHIYSEYRYFLACIDDNQTTYATAKANAQELTQRMREVVRTRYALGGEASTLVETVYETQILDMRVEVMGGNVGGDFRGVGVLPFIVRTEV